ncbi:ab578e04-baea-499b-a257-fee514b5e0ab [Thermothielavioides terrestris]|uniref:Ab578e04-baea-499b-a257-fee514b5e0ab n=1 Tax=Thermothielavioides terrestris TaxID=2587410 RepID=A0A446BES4_9PEZI|nr:ab578e04-baea-499b-a257-fee514b5e0ab [Thermothielavioides terrestris]
MAYKRMTPGQWRDERAAERKKKEAAKTQAGNSPAKPVLGPPKEIHTGLTPQQEVDFLAYLYTPIDGLSQWGYVPTPPTEEEIAKAREGDAASMGWEVCDRCVTRFQVFPGRREEDGALTSGGKCLHHPGRAYFPERTFGILEMPSKRYRCCQQVVGESPGCATADTHVFKTTSPARLAAVLPFVRTPPNPQAPTDRAVCFDCEMGYTVRGLELIRLTAISWPDGKELLDVLVQPVGEILDLNSRYSGVWPEDMRDAEPWTPEMAGGSSDKDETTNEPADEGTPQQQTPGQRKRKKMRIVPSPAVARDLLFSLISPTTPLIGHGLENDLNAVRIVHPTLIDTILLYPHRRGLPMRNGLRMLAETRLNWAIQAEATDEDGRAVGHDSAEDARAAGELVRLRVQEKWADMKAQGWRLVEGKFVPPGGGGDGGARPSGGPLSEEFIEESGDTRTGLRCDGTWVMVIIINNNIIIMKCVISGQVSKTRVLQW